MQKNLVPIKAEDYDELIAMFNILNVNYIIADERQEAESLACLLVKKGICDGVMSEDTDCLAFRVKEFYFNINLKDNKLSRLDISDLLSEVNLKDEEWLDLMILFGTDFNHNLTKIGPSKAFDLVKQYKSLENISSMINTESINYNRIRELFNCENFTLKIDSIHSNDKLKLHDIDTKRYLFYHNIHLL